MLLFLAFLIAPRVQAARVHGNIYGPGLELLKNSVIEVNSTPKQSLIAADGAYSFELAPGSYAIEALYSDQKLLFYAKEEINIEAEGNYVYDLILFEIPEIEELEFDESELALIEELLKEKEKPIMAVIATIAAIIIVIGIAVAYLLYRYKKLGQKKKPKRKKRKVKKVKEEALAISPDATLNEVLALIKKEKRITQKEIRKNMNVSEAKISLIITDLEDHGLIKKIKRGRGNVIIYQGT